VYCFDDAQMGEVMRQRDELQASPEFANRYDV
jgi:hypothetical protein